MLDTLLFLLILSPFIVAALCYVVRIGHIRSIIILLMGCLLAVTSILLFNKGPFSHTPPPLLGIPIHWLIIWGDDVLLLTMLYFGFKHRHLFTKILIIFQLAALDYFELFMVDQSKTFPLFVADNLSLIMVLIISIVGSLICVFAIPYMKTHEEHQGLEKSGQPRFFTFLVVIIGAMNGLVLSNNIIFMYMFFEVTTLGSFMLISHDQTEIAIRNAVRALWMNCLAGASFIVAMIWAYKTQGTVDAQKLIQAGHMGGIMLTPLALLCFAGMVKSAQIPFQSWLLGAMVAPTPTSALLHSSTMVKAGVYIALRFAPGYAGTFLGQCLAACGAFAFLATSAMAVSQSNGKKVLAYSTIGNLGLIFACAGINTPEAITAAILLIIFHAFSKGLLFLCVGDIEQHIGSRDIEVMRGLYAKMPRTALIAMVGIVTMMLPPFGVLLSKWMAVEAASKHLFVIVLLAVGSALMVMYWARWAGVLLSAPYADHVEPERQGVLTRLPLLVLVGGAVVLSLCAPLLYSKLIAPTLSSPSFSVRAGIFENPTGTFLLYPIMLILALGFFYAVYAAKRARKAHVSGPYMCGLQTTDPESFEGPMRKTVAVTSRIYYFESIFGEQRLNLWFNICGVMLLALLIGGAL
ncbi:MAG: proton-conducting transporter membrane subunit [Pseudomonadota bacterium]